ncbi:Clp protease ClpP [Lactobacillus paracasei subsp. paracasei]|uniref:head maturation protease, ClpP-related n=1 Tax=Lacticaseibacillus paracasei TaxID=1597 RepID=UPI0018C8006A|nr:head maturation protease, ClpP-related [Lacticaseibacillus paracasei]MBG1272446.1 Clp protease ClpP [Lacticaseibacillus paracasei subsp. paracasei]
MTKAIPINTELVEDETASVAKSFGLDLVSPQSVRDALPDDGSDVTIEINSPGGKVAAGSAIATMLKEYSGTVTAKIIGLAASAATVVALAADHIMMAPTATFMIHRVSATGVSGNAGDMDKLKDVLSMQDQQFANLYASRTGKTPDEMLKLMTDETYMSAEQAKELGFVDEIMFDEQLSLVAGPKTMLTPEIVDALKAYRKIKDKPSAPVINIDTDELAEKLANKLKPHEEPKQSKFAGFLF